MFDFRPIAPNPSTLSAYAELFNVCFPSAGHLGVKYLRWLYVDNPDGLVVGFDAFDGERLAAHYACIPVQLKLFGQQCKGLLSLNTATHPDYQGKGLFTKLASRTYDFAAENGFQGVYGIANSNSTPGFIKKLGFTLVSPLEARLGLGSLATIDWKRATEIAQFQRVWDAERLRWRSSNPANRAIVVAADKSEIQIRAATDKPLISAWARVGGSFTDLEPSSHILPRGSLFLGMLPAGTYRFQWSFNIPHQMRPSPLNFIFRGLRGDERVPESSRIICSFIDFDAY